MKSILFKLLFLLLALSIVYYITFVKTEKYESKMIIIIKDLSQEQSVSAFGSLLLPTGSESQQDARLLEVYMKSNDMYLLLDKEFNLTSYYSSQVIDSLNRLENEFLLPSFEETRVNFIKKYNEDLTIVFDELSSTIEVAFFHANSEVAKEIVESIVKHSGARLNYFDRENSKVVLAFLKEQEEKKYRLFLDSLKKLLIYQNTHNTISPKLEIEAKSAILAELEGKLVQQEVSYASQLLYMNVNTAEMRLLESTIINIKKRIKKIKTEMLGGEKGNRLNEDMSDFELLKSEVEFNKQVYMHTLAKLEETSVLVSQESKNLIVVSEAQVSDAYDHPKKLKEIFSILIVLGFIYGILGFIFVLIKDHKD